MLDNTNSSVRYVEKDFPINIITMITKHLFTRDAGFTVIFVAKPLPNEAISADTREKTIQCKVSVFS